MKNNNEMTDVSYWQNFFISTKNKEYKKSYLYKFFKKHIVYDKNKKCIEIGAYPGTHLGEVAKFFGYKPVALDFIPEVYKIKNDMINNGIYNCEIICEDFLSWDPKEKYDVVFSNGFIEHFQNYDFVIKKHIEILKPNGLLFINVPYLGGLQGILRKKLYKSDYYHEIIKSHNQAIMNLDKLQEIIFKKYKLKKIEARYVREMEIFMKLENIKENSKYLYFFFKVISKFFKLFKISNKFISPSILIVGKKNN